MQNENEKSILNDKEFALILGINLLTLKKLAKNGDIPCEYKNRRPIFNRAAVIKHFRMIEGGAA